MDAQTTTRASLLTSTAPHAPLPPAAAIVAADTRRKVLSAKWDGHDSFKVEEVAEILSLSRDLAYTAVRSGKIGSIRFGKRYVIPRRVIEELLGF